MTNVMKIAACPIAGSKYGLRERIVFTLRNLPYACFSKGKLIDAGAVAEGTCWQEYDLGSSS